MSYDYHCVFQNVVKRAGMVHWTEHSSPTNVPRLCVGSCRCSKRFFSRYSGFPLSSKTNILNISDVFQFNPESEGQSFIIYSLDYKMPPSLNKVVFNVCSYKEQTDVKR